MLQTGHADRKSVQLAAVFFPTSDAAGGLQFVFDWNDVAISLGLAMSTIPVFEIGKAIRRAAMKKENK